MLSQAFCFWDKQQSADSNTIQFRLLLKCMKDQPSYFCDCCLASNLIFHHHDSGLPKFHAGSVQPLVCVVTTLVTRPSNTTAQPIVRLGNIEFSLERF